MTPPEFNKELDDYLKRVSKRRPVSTPKKKPRKKFGVKDFKKRIAALVDSLKEKLKKKEKVEEELVKEEEEEFQQQLDTVEKEESVAEGEASPENEASSKKSSIIWSFLSKMNILNLIKKEDEEVEEESEELISLQDEIKEDMKELGKISVSILKMLSHEKLEQFRSTEDFKHFTEILKKHDVIK